MEAPGDNPSFEVRVLYFAALRELCGCREEELAVPIERARLEDFLAWLEGERPALRGQLGRIRCAIDGELAALGASLHAGSELALLPPFAGG